jgi:hypothetical protein
MSQRAHPVLVQVLTRFILLLKPQTRNIRCDGSKVVIGSPEGLLLTVICFQRGTITFHTLIGFAGTHEVDRANGVLG